METLVKSGLDSLEVILKLTEKYVQTFILEIPIVLGYYNCFVNQRDCFYLDSVIYIWKPMCSF